MARRHQFFNLIRSLLGMSGLPSKAPSKPSDTSPIVPSPEPSFAVVEVATPVVVAEEEENPALAHANWAIAQLLFYVGMTHLDIIDKHNKTFSTHLDHYTPEGLEKAWNLTKQLFESAQAVILASKENLRDEEKMANLGCESIATAIEVLNHPNPTLAQEIYNELWKMALALEKIYLPPNKISGPHSPDNIKWDEERERALVERVGLLAGVTAPENIFQCCAKMFHEHVDAGLSWNLGNKSTIYGQPKAIVFIFSVLFTLDGIATDQMPAAGRKKEIQKLTALLPEKTRRDLKVDLYDFYKIPLDVSGI